MINIPTPKKSPLRPIPETLSRHSEDVVIKEGQQQKAIIRLLGRSDINIMCETGSESTITLESDSRSPSRSTVHVAVQRNAHTKIQQHVSEQHRSEIELRITLAEEGAHANYTATFHGTKDDHHGCSVMLHHQAKHTTGNIVIRGVYEEKSRGVVAGLIKVDKNAQETNSYFQDDIILLDEGLAESLPTLEIEANDVKVSHGSTTSRINKEQIFYLQSRGITQADARQMIVNGFLNLPSFS